MNKNPKHPNQEVDDLKNIIKMYEENALLMWEMIEDFTAIIDVPDSHPMAKDWAKALTMVQEAKKLLNEKIKKSEY